MQRYDNPADFQKQSKIFMVLKHPEGFISDVTDKILPQIEDWQNRPLDEVYQSCILMRFTIPSVIME